MSGCCITKGIAASFKKVTLLVSLLALCYASIPYPFCYHLVSRDEDANDLRLYFTRNEFFICKETSMNTRMFINTEKNVVVYLDGSLYKRLPKEELCKGQ